MTIRSGNGPPCSRTRGSAAGPPGASRRSRRGTGVASEPCPTAVRRHVRAYSELPVLAPAHPAVFADDHRRHGLAALDRRDVEALDAPRQRRQRQHRAQRLERLVVRRGLRVEAASVGQRRVARRQIEQALASRRAAARPDAHAVRPARAQPRFERLGLLDGDGHVNLGRRRRRSRRTAAPRPVSTSVSARRRAGRASVTSSTRSIDAAAPHLEHLDDGARAARLQSRTRRVARAPALAIFCCRSRSVSTVRIASRSCAACSYRSACGRLLHPAAQIARELLGPAFEKQPRVLHRALYSASEQIVSTHGARQRWMSYSRHGRARLPVITSLHERMPNSRCVSAIVRRASRAGRNGPA